jgi:hypothetical protein
MFQHRLHRHRQLITAEQIGKDVGQRATHFAPDQVRDTSHMHSEACDTHMTIHEQHRDIGVIQ